VDTVFVLTSPDSAYLSASLVKEVATWGGVLAGLVPAPVLRRLTARVSRPPGDT
jgi:pantetheine-phosphate adenylyltransferase